MDDRELLQVLQKNPENGMRLVMKEYTGLCYYIVKQKLADFSAEEIEECVSDVFLAFYHQYTAIDLKRGSIKGFLAVLSRRKAVDRWRKLAGKETLPLQEEITAADTLEQQEDRQILLDAVRALGDPDGKILLLKYYFGYPSKMIAEVYGLQENTVNQKIRRSLAKVKAILEGGVCHEG